MYCDKELVVDEGMTLELLILKSAKPPRVPDHCRFV